MKKLFISQPMRGFTDEEILKAREEIRVKAEKVIGEPVELIDSFISKSVQFLSQADVAYFGGDWRNARGCKIEHEIAVQYDIDRIEE